MRLGWRFYRLLCQIACTAYLGLRVRHRERVPRTGGVLIASNHQSFLDPVLVMVWLQREASFMARDSLFKNALFRRLITYLNAFPVKRGSADISAIKECLRRLKGGHALVAFPEGTRTPDGRVQPLIGGVVLVARKAKAPIVPTAIVGAYEAWPRTSKLPQPRRIVVAYDHPIMPEELDGLSDEEVVALLQRRIEALYAAHRNDPWLAGRLQALPA
jgi:1-acyl-sn-glycerol-3-phosphate acyltransferase